MLYLPVVAAVSVQVDGHPPEMAEEDERPGQRRPLKELVDQTEAIEAPRRLCLLLDILKCAAETKDWQLHTNSLRL